MDIDDNLEEDMAGKSLIHLMIKAGFKDEEIFQELFMFIVVVRYSIRDLYEIMLSFLKIGVIRCF